MLSNQSRRVDQKKEKKESVAEGFKPTLNIFEYNFRVHGEAAAAYQQTQQQHWGSGIGGNNTTRCTEGTCAAPKRYHSYLDR